jgi:hypothetical protein
MNCCDYDCNQGRDCPARVAKARPVMRAADPLPPSETDDFLHGIAVTAVVTIGASLVGCLLLIIIAATTDFAPAKRVIDCSLESFSPDFTPAMREACRTRKPS